MSPPRFYLSGRRRPALVRQGEPPADPSLTLDAFVDQHDASLHGSTGSATSTANGQPPDLARVLSAAALRISNGFSDLGGLYRHLDAVNLLDEQRLRPGWDLYFMVSQRWSVGSRRRSRPSRPTAPTA